MKRKALTFSLLYSGLIFLWHCSKGDCEFAHSKVTIKYNSAETSIRTYQNMGDTIPFKKIEELLIYYNFNYDVLSSEPLASKLSFSNPFALYACPPSFTEYHPIHQMKNIIIKTSADINDTIKSGDTINPYLLFRHPYRSNYHDSLFTLQEVLKDSIHFFHSESKHAPLYIKLQLDSTILPKNKNLQLTATFTFDDGTTLLSDSKKLFIKD